MKNPSLEIIVTERCSTGGCPLEEACEHCYLIQSAISVAISYIISVYCEDYAGYFIDVLLFLSFQFCFTYFIYLVSCTTHQLLVSTMYSTCTSTKIPHQFHHPNLICSSIIDLVYMITFLQTFLNFNNKILTFSSNFSLVSHA
jgi:hypothetical protein